MVMPVITTTYKCEVCGSEYKTEEEAKRCEAVPIPPVTLQAGALVGGGHHGWWNADTSWTISQFAGAKHWLDVPDKGWQKSPPGPFHPVKRVFLPLWIVIGQRVTDKHHWAHRREYLLWTPRHANRGVKREGEVAEALALTYSSGHLGLFKVPEKFRPELTETERERLATLIANPPWQEGHLL